MESVSFFGAGGISVTRPVLETVSLFAGWGVSRTHPVLKSVCSFVGKESLFHAIFWKLSYQTEGGQSLSNTLCTFLSGRLPDEEFHLHAPCWILFVGLGVIRLVVRQVGTFSYTHPGTCLVVRWVGSLSYTPCPGIGLVIRREESFSYALRAAVCLVVRRERSISYPPRASMCFV